MVVNIRFKYVGYLYRSLFFLLDFVGLLVVVMLFGCILIIFWKFDVNLVVDVLVIFLLFILLFKSNIFFGLIWFLDFLIWWFWFVKDFLLWFLLIFVVKLYRIFWRDLCFFIFDIKILNKLVFVRFIKLFLVDGLEFWLFVNFEVKVIFEFIFNIEFSCFKIVFFFLVLVFLLIECEFKFCGINFLVVVGVGGFIFVVVFLMFFLICWRLIDFDVVCWVGVIDDDVIVCFVICFNVIFGFVVGMLVICLLYDVIVVVWKDEGGNVVDCLFSKSLKKKIKICF